jgi:plasmid stabilization system protein ParE
MKRVIFHPQVQQDFNEGLHYYEQEAGLKVAARFEDEVENAVKLIATDPQRFGWYLQRRTHRRIKLPSFPWVLLFRETTSSIRVTVLKHVKRRPDFGLKRK